MENMNKAIKAFSRPNRKITNIIFLQFSILILSLSSVVAKKASFYTISSSGFWILFGLEISIFGVYAIAWQQIIKRVEISIAYANKGTQIIWTLIWAIIFFKEKITITNLLGTVCIIIGIMLVQKDVK